MNLKTTLASLILIAIVASITFAVASTAVEYFHPHTVTVSKIALKEYLEGTLIANGTTIAWGTLNATETYAYNYTVKNVGSLNCTIILTVKDLPVGWTLTWAGNKTVLAVGKQVSEDLILSIPASAEGSYSWSTKLIATG